MAGCPHGVWIAKRDRKGRRIGDYICPYCGKRIKNREQAKILDYLKEEGDKGRMVIYERIVIKALKDVEQP